MDPRGAAELLPVAPLIQTGRPKPPVGQATSVDLCMIVGADNRAGLVETTLRLCLPHFHRVHILDTGSTDGTDKLATLSPKIRYNRLAGYTGKLHEAYMMVTREVETWDWFLLLDSDERPSQNFLDHLPEIVLESNHRDANCRPFHLYLHLWSEGRMICRHMPSIPGKQFSQMVDETGKPKISGFMLYRFWQKTPGLVATGWGSHGGFKIEGGHPYAPLELPMEYYVLHCKTVSERLMGTFVYSWVWPQSHSIYGDTPQYRELMEVKEKLRLNTFNELTAMIYERRLPTEVIELMRRWREREPTSEKEKQDLRVPKEMAVFVLDHYGQGKEIEKYGFCGERCCLYKEGQL